MLYKLIAGFLVCSYRKGTHHIEFANRRAFLSIIMVLVLTTGIVPGLAFADVGEDNTQMEGGLVANYTLQNIEESSEPTPDDQTIGNHTTQGGDATETIPETAELSEDSSDSSLSERNDFSEDAPAIEDANGGILQPLAEEKYVVYDETTGSILGSFPTLAQATGFLGNTIYEGGTFRIVLTENDPDMGNNAIVPNDRTIILTSGDGGPYTITCKRVADLTNSQDHISQVAGHLILRDIVLDGNGAGGGITVIKYIATSPASLTLEEGAVIQNCADKLNAGGAISVIGSNCTVTINGGVIQNCKNAQNGGAVSIPIGSTFVMTAGTIKDNSSEKSGGAVISRGVFNMTGGLISGNSSNQYGGGVAFAQNLGSLQFSGGTISDNYARIDGGGIYFENATSLYTIDDGAIINNEAGRYGGGISLNLGELSIKEATVSGNKITDSATSSYGGGIFTGSGSITATATAITGNSALYGAGLYLSGNTSKLNGCKISGNIGTYGGGLFLSGNILEFNECEIRGNIGIYGGGAYLNNGTAVITHSNVLSNESEYGSGFFLNGFALTLTDTLLDSNAATAQGGGLYVTATSSVVANGQTSFIRNSSGENGGAIFTADFSYEDPADSAKYQNLDIANTVVFSQNNAVDGLFAPPSNADDFVNLGFFSTSVLSFVTHDHVLNNWDINYLNDGEPVVFVKITYHANGGEGGSEEMVSAALPHTVKTAETAGVTRAGYEFIGWNTSADGLGDAYFAGNELAVERDITLYAQWRIKNSPSPDPNPTPPTDITAHQPGTNIPKTGDDIDVIPLGILLGTLLVAGALLLRTGYRRQQR